MHRRRANEKFQREDIASQLLQFAGNKELALFLRPENFSGQNITPKQEMGHGSISLPERCRELRSQTALPAQ